MGPPGAPEGVAASVSVSVSASAPASASAAYPTPHADEHEDADFALAFSDAATQPQDPGLPEDFIPGTPSQHAQNRDSVANILVDSLVNMLW